MIQFKDRTKYIHSKGIYQIRNIKNEFVYIGQTHESFNRRFLLHNFLLRNNKHDNINLQADYNKFGKECFVFETLKVINGDENLDELEKEYIRLARNVNKCYNISDGGKGATGVPMTEENRRFHAEHNRIINLGKKASQETKFKMSQSHRKNPPSKEQLEYMKKRKEENYLNGAQTKANKITANEAKEIKIALMNNISYDKLSMEYKVSRSNINAIRSNRSWTFVEVEGWDEYCKANKNNSRARQSRSANSNESARTTDKELPE